MTEYIKRIKNIILQNRFLLFGEILFIVVITIVLYGNPEVITSIAVASVFGAFTCKINEDAKIKQKIEVNTNK